MIMTYPKTENQAEDWFYHELNKRTDAKITPQYSVPVGSSPYRLDFLIQSEKLSVGFEVDGKDYHDTQSDSIRDKRILSKYPEINSIVRFEAHDIYWNAPLATLFICDHFPKLIFSCVPPSKRAMTAGDIIELMNTHKGEYSRVNLSHRNAWSYLNMQGVYKMHLLSNTNKSGYTVYIYSVYFMGSRESKYFDNIDYGLEPDPMKYCSVKTSKVKVMAL